MNDSVKLMFNGRRPPVIVGGDAGGPVVPDSGRQGEETLSDAGEHALGGTCTVSFEVELTFEALVDRLDPLAHAAVGVGLVAAIGAQQTQAHRIGEFLER